MVQRRAAREVQHHAVVRLGIAETVDRGYGRDDDDVAALEHRLGRRQPHLLDVAVDRRVLLDVGVARGDVGLGLVIVVVRNEVLDGVVREELAHLAVELRREGLVVREDQRRPLHGADHGSHRKRLSRAGHAEQRLLREPVAGAHRRGARSPAADRRPARNSATSCSGRSVMEWVAPVGAPSAAF